MTAPRVVAMLDHGRQRGGLARAGGADHQDQTTLLHDQILQDRRQPQRFDAGGLRPQIADDERNMPALSEDIDAEAPDLRNREREVHLPGLLEVLLLLLRHHLVGDLLDRLGIQHVRVDGHDRAEDLDGKGHAGRDEQVGSLLLGRQLEHRSQIHGCPLDEGPAHSTQAAEARFGALARLEGPVLASRLARTRCRSRLSQAPSVCDPRATKPSSLPDIVKNRPANQQVLPRGYSGLVGNGHGHRISPPAAVR